MTTIDLVDTSASQVSAELVAARRRTGSPGIMQVLTLVVVASESEHYDALRASLESAREHPSRILVIIPRGGRGAGRLDAELRVGVGGPGDTIVLRLHGELAAHADSVVLPLLLPDVPIVVWWPGKAPAVPADDPLGRLAQRRLTDLASEPRPAAALRSRCAGYHPGDTDLAWTRLTPWRALLAAALDQYPHPLTGATVTGERGTPSADLLVSWLAWRLKVPVDRAFSRGPGLTSVRLDGRHGTIDIQRPDGRMAQLTVPGNPERPVALRRRDTSELLAEELRRLDPDDIYAGTLVAHAKASPTTATSTTTGTSKATSKRAAARTAPQGARAKAVPKKVVPKKAVPKKAVPKKTVPKKTAAKQAGTTSAGATKATSAGSGRAAKPRAAKSAKPPTRSAAPPPDSTTQPAM